MLPLVAGSTTLNGSGLCPLGFIFLGVWLLTLAVDRWDAERWMARACGLVRFALLFAVWCFGSLAWAQTSVQNTATIAPPVGISNTNPAASCVSGICASVDSDGVAASRPLVGKAFAPTSIAVGGTALLTITLTNTHVLRSATLSSPLVDTYPAGIVNAAVPLAQTSCVGGGLVAAAGGGTLSLGSGAAIPAGGGVPLLLLSRPPGLLVAW